MLVWQRGECPTFLPLLQNLSSPTKRTHGYRISVSDSLVIFPFIWLEMNAVNSQRYINLFWMQSAFEQHIILAYSKRMVFVLAMVNIVLSSAVAANLCPGASFAKLYSFFFSVYSFL